MREYLIDRRSGIRHINTIAREAQWTGGVILASIGVDNGVNNKDGNCQSRQRQSKPQGRNAVRISMSGQSYRLFITHRVGAP